MKYEYEQGLRQAAQHLVALGHRQIAYISGPASLKSAMTRRQAFLQAASELHLAIPPRLVIEGDHAANGGSVAARSLLSLLNRPSATIRSNDLTALGVKRSAHDAGVRISQDLSLIGFDDIWLAEYMAPPLTTVQMSQVELARLAFRAMLIEAQWNKHPEGGSQCVLETILIVRGSTAQLVPPNGRSQVQNLLK